MTAASAPALFPILCAIPSGITQSNLPQQYRTIGSTAQCTHQLISIPMILLEHSGKGEYDLFFCYMFPRATSSYHTARKFLCFGFAWTIVWRCALLSHPIMFIQNPFRSYFSFAPGYLLGQIMTMVVFIPVSGSSVYTSLIIDRWLKTGAVNRKEQTMWYTLWNSAAQTNDHTFRKMNDKPN